MMKPIKSILPCVFLSVVLSYAHAAVPAEKPSVFQWDGRHLSVKGSHLNLLSVLERISDLTGLDIYLFDPVRKEAVSVDLRERDLHEALHALLKRYNYALVFKQERPDDGCLPSGDRPGNHLGGPGGEQGCTTGAYLPHGENDMIRNDYSEGRVVVFLTASADRMSMNEPWQMPQSVTGTCATKAEVNTGIQKDHSHSTETLLKEGGGAGRFAGPVPVSTTVDSSSASFLNQEGTEPSQDARDAEMQTVAKAGLSAFSDEARDVSGDLGESEDTTQTTSYSSKAESLEMLILEIESRLSSGQSDKQYDYWVKVYGDEKHVMHDSELLETTRNRLARLKGY